MVICFPFDVCHHRWGQLLGRLLVFGLVVATVTGLTSFWAPADADDSPSIESMLEQIDEDDVSDTETGLPESTTNPGRIGMQWGLWQRSIDEKQGAGIDELDALRDDAVSIGLPSLPHHQLAILDTLRQADQHDLDEEQIEDLFDAAHRMAPHLPYAHLEEAHWQADREFSEIPYALPAYLSGLEQGTWWLDTRIGWTLQYSLLVLLALGIGFVGFLFSQLLRYFGIAAYDGTRVLPRGFSSTQTVILLTAVVLVPGLVMQSPLLSLVLLSLLIVPFQQLNERVVALVFFVILAALPWLDDRLGQYMAYPDSEAQRLLHANYHGCDDDCLAWLDDTAFESEGTARLVERIAAFRSAESDRLDELDTWFEEHDPAAADDGLTVYWHSLHGAILIAVGDYDEALDVLESATDADSSAVEPWFNQARAHQLLDDHDTSEVAFHQSFERDDDRTSLVLANSQRDPHSFLMVPLLEPEYLWDHHAPPMDDAPSLVTPMWSIVAGEQVDLEWARWLGLAGIVFLIVTLPLYLGHRVSTPCPKCGLARDPTDTDETANHHYCLPCYQTFVSGASLDYHARVHSEATLGRRDRIQRLMRRTFSLLTPGLGHVLAGHAVRGMIAFVFVAFGALVLLFPMGPFGAWRPPLELFREHWIGADILAWILISIGACVGLTGLIRGIESTRRTTDTNSGKS